MEQNRKTILIVDDERFYINLLVDLLADDYQTMVAKNSKEAFERALNRPDLVLLDVVMPEMDGYQVCEQLKNDPRTADIPIIFLTVKSDIDDEVRGFELGAVDYITKPISPPIVKARVATHLALSEANKILQQENTQLISEQRKKDEQLRCSQKLQALGRLTGGIAHDFNNILGIIIGYAELLQANLKDNEQLENYINQVLHAGDRGEKITHKLLSFSRQKTFEPSVFNVNEVLEQQLGMLQKTLTPGIQINLKLESDLGSIRVDRDDLENAILNISINAMHAMHNVGRFDIRTWNLQVPNGGPAGSDLEPGQYVCVSLTDNGCGMDEETLNHIFEPFFSTKGEAGTGLGMSQVFGFMQRSDGHINVESRPQQGSTITLYFPMQDAEPEQIEKPSSSSAFKDTEALNNEAILVVDDEEPLRALMDEVLSEHGYRVFTAENADRALEILQQQHIDIMLTDVIMPGMNGYQLAMEVQRLYPQVKIQVISGYGENHFEGTVHQELHQNRLIKPVYASELLKRIRSLV